MPTELPRYSITETPDIAAAIDTGTAMMPGASRAQVARSLILQGAQAARTHSAVRAAAVDKWAGCLTGAYPSHADASKGGSK